MSLTINKKILLLVSVIIFFISLLGGNHHDLDSDPKGTLITTQSIINYGTIKLDLNEESRKEYPWQVKMKNNHYYYYFPLGAAVSGIPIVYIAINVFNMNMYNSEHDKIVQKVIASIIVSLLFLLLYYIALNYLSQIVSLSIAIVFLLGTSFSSTLANALWSQGFATIYSLISLYCLINIVKHNKDYLWTCLSIALFMAYLARPTMSLLIISVLLFMFFSNKKILSVKVFFLVLTFLVFLVIFSLYEYGQFLPDYYLPQRLGSDTFWIALYGNLLSPARGIFVYSPFLLVFILYAKLLVKILIEQKQLIIFAFWIVIHYYVISNFSHWWGGGSYGSRLSIDVLPPIYVLLIVLIANFKKINFIQHKLTVIFLAFTVILSIYINAIQGLFNDYTSEWNINPSIDQNPKYLFDWRYPQFLHNEKSHVERIKEHNFQKTNGTYSFKFNGKELSSQTGRVLDNSVVATKDKDQPGYITFGPYVELPKGVYRFDIIYNSPASTNTKVGNWDVVVNLSAKMMEISSGDINGTNGEEQHIKGEFIVEEEYSYKKIEIRSFYNAVDNLSIRKLTIDKVD